MPAANGPRIRDRRHELDLSPADLAQRVDISPGYLRNIEGGYDECSMRVMYRLARALALPIEEIRAADYPDPPPKQPENKPSHPPKRDEDNKAPKREGEAA